MCNRRQVERLRKMIPRSCKNSSTAMARIQVPKKGTFTCDSSTAEEAVEYLQQVSLGCGWIWCASRKKNKLSKKWRFPIRGRTPKSVIYKFGFPLWTIQLLGYQMSTFGLWLGSGFAIFSVNFLIDDLIILIDSCDIFSNWWLSIWFELLMIFSNQMKHGTPGGRPTKHPRNRASGWMSLGTAMCCCPVVHRSWNPNSSCRNSMLILCLAASEGRIVRAV